MDAQHAITLARSGLGPLSHLTSGQLDTLQTDVTAGNTALTLANVAMQRDNAAARAAPFGTTQAAIVEISNAEVKLLNSVVKTLVAAPAAGQMLELLKAWLFFDYTGAWTESADNLAIYWGTAAGSKASEDIEATGFVDATADSAIEVAPRASAVIAKTAVDAKALVLANTGNGEYGGGNDANVLRAVVFYRTVPCGW